MFPFGTMKHLRSVVLCTELCFELQHCCHFCHFCLLLPPSPPIFFLLFVMHFSSACFYIRRSRTKATLDIYCKICLKKNIVKIVIYYQLFLNSCSQCSRGGGSALQLMLHMAAHLKSHSLNTLPNELRAKQTANELSHLHRQVNSLLPTIFFAGMHRYGSHFVFASSYAPWQQQQTLALQFPVAAQHKQTFILCSISHTCQLPQKYGTTPPPSPTLLAAFLVTVTVTVTVSLINLNSRLQQKLLRTSHARFYLWPRKEKLKYERK